LEPEVGHSEAIDVRVDDADRNLAAGMALVKHLFQREPILGPLARHMLRPRHNQLEYGRYYAPLKWAEKTMNSRENLEAPEPVRTIKLEGAAIDREHATNPLPLSDAHDSGIRQVHRQVMILVHQLAHAWKIIHIEPRNVHRLTIDKIPQSVLSSRNPSEQMHCFSKRGPNC